MIVAFCVVTLLIKSQKDFCKKTPLQQFRSFLCRCFWPNSCWLILRLIRTARWQLIRSTESPFNPRITRSSVFSITFCHLPWLWNQLSALSRELHPRHSPSHSFHRNHPGSTFTLIMSLFITLTPFHSRPDSKPTSTNPSHSTIDPAPTPPTGLVAAFTDSRLLDSFSSLSF